MPSAKGKGLAGAVLFHTAVLVIFLIVSFSVPIPEPETGILINFGFDETGSGLIEPSAQASPPASTSPPEAAAVTNPAEEALVTQDFDKEVPEVKKVDPEAEKRKQEQIEAEQKRRAELEAERIRKQKEEEERKRLEAEQRRMDEMMSKTKNAFSGAQNTGTSSTSEGIAGGKGNQGVPQGSPDSKIRGESSGTGTVISYDLGGRGSQYFHQPVYDYQGEGRVVVEVTVDRSGKVTQANPGVKGSTTLDEYLLGLAKEAALKTKFETKPDAPIFQKGTITYNFVFK